MKKNHWSHNWQAKLICFLISLVIWLYLKNLVQPGFVDQLMTGTITDGR